jgi:hypothetical protein
MRQPLGTASRYTPAGLSPHSPGWGRTADVQQRPVNFLSHHAISLILISLLPLSFAAQVLGAFHWIVSGDEFIFLDITYRVANGHAVSLLQTPYAHLFGWLTHIGDDEIRQITLARLLYLVFWAGSLALLYQLARRLIDPLGALASVVFFALFSYSIWNATSFRIDGLLLPILLSIVLLLLNPTTARVAAAGVLSGVALAFSIKAVLWAPTFIGVLAVGLWDRKDPLKSVVAGAVAGALTFVGIMIVHSWLTSATPKPEVLGGLATTGAYMFAELGLFPRSDILALAVLQNLVTWTLIVVGLGLTATDLRRPPARRNALLLLLLVLPVLSVAFYANSFPYAYVVLMPTACLLAGRGFSRFLGRGGRLGGIAALVCLAAAALPLFLIVKDSQIDRQEAQKQILSHVHELFKKPVPYIDSCGMVSSFPRQIRFLTKWGVRTYREAGIPELAHYIHSAHPPLLIANKPLLDVRERGAAEELEPDLRLLRQDAETVRATYAHYWGRIYLAGREWRDLPGDKNLSFEIIIPGTYTLIADHAVTVDGHLHKPGATLTLEAGPHVLRTMLVESDLRLLWGSGTTIPPEEPSNIPIYEGL